MLGDGYNGGEQVYNDSDPAYMVPSFALSSSTLFLFLFSLCFGVSFFFILHLFQCSDQDPNGPVYNCDRGGCGTNAHEVENGNGMCPGEHCMINTDLPFKYSIHFGDKYRVTLTQGNAKIEFDACQKGDYLAKMDKALERGMVLVMSHWGTTYNTMSWLDGMTGCSGDCDTSGKVCFHFC